MNSSQQNSSSRRHVVQFLYQSEADKVFYFSVGHFERFLESFEVSSELHKVAKDMAQGTLDKLTDIDVLIENATKNWKLSRMSATDRAVIRLATYELLHMDTPTKVVINEAIDIAKLYGTEKSGSFVNGILDALAQKIRSNPLQQVVNEL